MSISRFFLFFIIQHLFILHGERSVLREAEDFLEIVCSMLRSHADVASRVRIACCFSACSSYKCSTMLEPNEFIRGQPLRGILYSVHFSGLICVSHGELAQSEWECVVGRE